jgi:hypothetical protein
VEAAAALIVEWLAHEGREEALTGGDVLDRRLEDEGAVGREHGVGVPEVDLVLRRAELVIASESSDVELVAHAQRVQEVAVRVDHRAGRVDEALVIEGPLPAAVALRHDVVLQLGAGHGSEPELGVAIDDALQHRARCCRVR